MIKPLASTAPASLSAVRAEGVTRAAAAKPVATGVQPAPASAAGALAAAGPPIDAAKVARIKGAIATGGYAPDPDAIAARMLDLDLPKAP